MPRKDVPALDEKKLSKGHLRKLTALRKSLGENIADRAFSEWFTTQGTEKAATGDRNAELIAEALEPLIEASKLKIRRGGYIVRRGRGRVIVEPATGS